MTVLRAPLLVVLGGLPATGKSTLARALAGRLRAVHVRVDTIETAVTRAEGEHAVTNGWTLPPGYAVGQDVARDQLRLGLDVVADSVNPVEESRRGWRRVGSDSGARVVEVEVECSDPAEHRRRAEHRVVDVAGLVPPTWAEIVARQYEPWRRDRLVVDTSLLTTDEAVARIVAASRPTARG